jgi:hypothetical protein
MDIADILVEFGAYYLNNGQNMGRLYRQLRQPTTTEQVMTTFLTEETRYQASESRIDRVLQPFQKAWTPISEVQFVPIIIEQFKMKMDHQEYPDDLEGTWLGFLSSGDLNRAEWPFIRWLVEMELIPQIMEDYELEEIFYGVQAAPTPGTPGAVGTSINGLRKQINDQVTAGRITPIATGVPATVATDFVDQVEGFVDAINTKYWNISMQLMLNQTLHRRFMRGYKEKYGQYTDYRQNNEAMVDFSNITLLGCPSFKNSPKFVVTPRSNILHLGKKTQNMNRVRLETEDRLVKIFTDFWRGVGFLIPEIVFTNDQDLV